MRSYTWNELTVAEQNEATERGFPRGADIRYCVHNDGKYRGGWKLAKFVRVA